MVVLPGLLDWIVTPQVMVPLFIGFLLVFAYVGERIDEYRAEREEGKRRR